MILTHHTIEIKTVTQSPFRSEEMKMRCRAYRVSEIIANGLWAADGGAGKLNWTKAAEDNVSHSFATWHNYQKTEIWFSMEICSYIKIKRFTRMMVEWEQQAGAIRLSGERFVQFECKTDNFFKTSTVDWHDTAVDMQLFMIAFGNDDVNGGGEEIKRKSTPSLVRTSVVCCTTATTTLNNYTSFALYYRVAWNELWSRDNNSASASSLIGPTTIRSHSRGQHKRMQKIFRKNKINANQWRRRNEKKKENKMRIHCRPKSEWNEKPAKCGAISL